MACLPKAPAYQEYPGDILNNEIFVRMTYDERGLYWTLRMYSWQNETLPSDLLELSEICRLDHDHFKRLWEPRISRFFAPCPGQPSRIVEPSLEAYRKKLQAQKQSRQASGKRGAEVRWPESNTEVAQVNISNENEMAM
jgi:hypothetical protein